MIETCKALHEGFDEKRREVRAEKSKKIRELTDPNHAWGGGFEDAPEAEAVTEIEAEAAPIPLAAEPAMVAETADIEEKAAAAGYHKYKALYDYEARNEDELSFSINDIIMVHPEQEHEPGWLGGELNGKIGWFPEAYAERCGDGIELSLQPIAEVSETGSENGSFQVKIFSLNLSKVVMSKFSFRVKPRIYLWNPDFYGMVDCFIYRNLELVCKKLHRQTPLLLLLLMLPQKPLQTSAVILFRENNRKLTVKR